MTSACCDVGDAPSDFHLDLRLVFLLHVVNQEIEYASVDYLLDGRRGIGEKSADSDGSSNNGKSYLGLDELDEFIEHIEADGKSVKSK